MKLTIVFIVLMGTAWGDTCTTSASSTLIDWNDHTKWSCGHVPTNGDSCVIAATTSKIQVTGSQTCGSITQNGTGNSIVESIEVLADGILTVDGTNGQSGNVEMQRATAFLVHGGRLIFKPPPGVAATMQYITGTGTAIPLLELCGDAMCTDKLPSSEWRRAIDVINDSGSSLQITYSNSIGPTANLHNVILNNLGSSAVMGWSMCNTVAFGGTLTYHNVLVTHSGSFRAANCLNAATAKLDVDNLIVYGSVDRTGNNNRALHFDCRTALTAGSTMNNVFIVNPPMLSSNFRQPIMFMNINGGIKMGSYSGAGSDTSDVLGFFAYNAPMTIGPIPLTRGYTIRNFATILDYQPYNGVTYNFQPTFNNGSSIDHGLFYINLQHNHNINIPSGNDGGIPGDVFDHFWVDYGSILSGAASHVFSGAASWTVRSILSNSLITSRGGDVLAVFGLDYVNNTIINGISAGIISGHTVPIGNPDLVNSIRNQLFMNNSAGIGSVIHGGVVAYPVEFRRQNLVRGIDHNAFWQIANSGDPGAVVRGSGLKTMSNPAIGTNNSYMSTLWDGGKVATAQSVASNSCANGCAGQVITTSGSYAGAHRGDIFATTSGTAWDVISEATENSITLHNGCGSAMTDCTTNVTVGSTAWTIYQGWSARPAYGIYGVDANFGTHDIHANPQFADPGRTHCTYVVSKGLQGIGNGATAQGMKDGCWDITPPGGGINGYFTATAGTNGTTIACSSCFFQSWGINTSDIVTINATALDGDQRCAVRVHSVNSETQLTIESTPSCTGGQTPSPTGPMPNDRFFFITPSMNLAKYIMAASGWTFTGDPTEGYTLVPVAQRKWSFRDAWVYAAGGFTPHNPLFAHAGEGGTYIGAFPPEEPVTPPTPTEGWHVGHIGPNPPSR